MYKQDHFLSDIIPYWSFLQLHFLFSLTRLGLIAPPTLDLHSDGSKKKQVAGFSICRGKIINKWSLQKLHYTPTVSIFNLIVHIL